MKDRLLDDRAERAAGGDIRGRLLEAIALAIATHDEFDDALQAVLRHICELTGWTYGQAWLPVPGRERLRCARAWYARSGGLEHFRMYCLSLEAPSGKGLLFRAWQTGEPQWVRDVSTDDQFNRAHAAAEAGLKAGVALPVRAGDEVVTILEFFMDHAHEQDGRQLHLLSASVAQLSPLIKRKRAEQALRESEERYRSLVIATSQIVWHADAFGNSTNPSPGWQAYTGQGDKAVLGTGWLDAVHPDDLPRVRAAWRAAIDAQSLFAVQCRIRRHDGVYRYFAARGVPVLAPDGSVREWIGSCSDITDRKRAEEINERLGRILDDSSNEIYVFDAASLRYLQANRGALKNLGYSLEEIQGMRFWEVAELKPLELEPLLEPLRTGGQDRIVFQTRHRRRYGTAYPVEVSLHFSRTEDPPVYVAIVQDITERKRVEEHIHQLAFYDALTGLPNRVLFNDRLDQALIDADRNERLVGVMFLDVDRFKNINDTLGHEAGDELLREVARRLIGVVRRGDTVARLSGDEFTVVLASLRHVDDAAKVAEKVLEQFSRPFQVAGRELYVTASIGLTLCPFDDTEPQVLLRNADIAMYRAKETGRNAYQFYTADMTRRAAEHLSLEHALRRALDDGDFELYYQPIVELRTGAVLSVEALLRWRHASRGWIAPDIFVPIAEESGLILPLGEWVLREAIAQRVQWSAEGVPQFRVGVNLSARQCVQPSFANRVLALLAEHDLPPDTLELEITEGVLMQETDAARANLETLSTAGVRLAIDDFGTRYSSFSYLKRFQVSSLKIDRSFVRGLPSNAGDVAIARSLIVMGHALGIRVVAEGIEQPAQLEFLTRQGCDAAQGDHLQPPLPAGECAARLRVRGRPAESA